MFHGQDENRIVPPESEVRLLAEFSSPLFFFLFFFFLFSILLTDKLISLLSLVRMSDQDHHPPALQPRMELQVWELQVEEHLQEQHRTLPKKHDDENIPHQT